MSRQVKYQKGVIEMSASSKKEVLLPSGSEAEEESWKWGDLANEVRRLRSKVEDAREDYAKLPWSEVVEYDHVIGQLEELEYYMKGREEELSPGTAELEAKHDSYSLYSQSEASIAGEAALYGINYVGLHEVNQLEEKERVMKYILEHGLSDMSYERTRYAVKEYRRKYLEELMERERTPSEAEEYGVYTLHY